MPEQSEISFFQLPKSEKRTVITVTLDDGTIVERDPSDLESLPPGLTVPLALLAPGGVA